MEDKIQGAIENIAENQGLKDYIIETSNVLKGNGFLGIITPLKIIEKNVKRKLNCIIKAAPNSQALREKVPIEELFTTEIHVYRTIFPIFEYFERKKSQRATQFSPKFYYSTSDKQHETLILEDLNEAGFKLHPLGCTMDGNHVSIVMKIYAQLHAISFALCDQEPEKFYKITENMKKNGYIPNLRTLKASLYNLYEKALLALDVVEDWKAIEKYNSFVSNIELLFEEILNLSTGKYCAILHGDSWSNNMMFNYEDENKLKRPISVRFLDFQMSRLGYPVMDLANFIYTNSSKEVLDSLDFYLNLYYQTFSNYMKKLGSDPERVYPFHVLMEQWKKYARIYLLLTPLEIVSKDYSDTPDFEIMADSDEDIGDAFNFKIMEIDVFNDRMRHVITHFVDNNFL